ncbi:MAG: ATP-binding cassette domain-containing protein [Lachnospiraceae bacterium]|nr:ATP-binding cassette domain-containing protein [Lachnospiraceae bacterium]
MGTFQYKIFRVLIDSILGASSPWLIIPECLYIAGLWKILEKSGVKGWWALVPCARYYQLGRCAGRVPEGFKTCIGELIYLLPNAFAYDLIGNELLVDICTIISITLWFAVFAYKLQVFSGLIEVYGVRRRWIWLWMFPATRAVPALIWGWKDKYQPEWKVDDIQAAMAQKITVGNVETMEKGLTVNLKERATFESFRKKTLLWDIHMYIPPGHMVLLLGGSGAGKTTFVNAINGYEKADAEVVLNGTDMYREYKKMQYETGFVPQQDLMRYSDTVRNTLIDISAWRLPKDAAIKVRRKRVVEIMEMFGLTSIRNSQIKKLSGGQRKRLSIAMEMLSNPSLFILDEPDSGLDGVMARELMQKLRKAADGGTIVIVITHTPDRVIDFFDDVIVLAKDSSQAGRLAFYGSIPEAREFFGCERMEEIVKLINQTEEGGSGRAEEFIRKFTELEVQHA